MLLFYPSSSTRPTWGLIQNSWIMQKCVHWMQIHFAHCWTNFAPTLHAPTQTKGPLHLQWGLFIGRRLMNISFISCIIRRFTIMTLLNRIQTIKKKRKNKSLLGENTGCCCCCCRYCTLGNAVPIPLSGTALIICIPLVTVVLQTFVNKCLKCFHWFSAGREFQGFWSSI